MGGRVVSPIPLQTAQHRPMVLTVEPGLHGGRVTLVGSGHWEPLGDFVSPDEARAAADAARVVVNSFWAMRALGRSRSR